MSAIASLRRPDFAEIVGDELRLDRVAETDAHEGPVYVPGHDALYFTTLPQRDRDGVPKPMATAIAKESA
jgi:gluconolactonase